MKEIAGEFTVRYPTDSGSVKAVEEAMNGGNAFFQDLTLQVN